MNAMVSNNDVVDDAVHATYAPYHNDGACVGDALLTGLLTEVPVEVARTGRGRVAAVEEDNDDGVPPVELPTDGVMIGGSISTSSSVVVGRGRTLGLLYPPVLLLLMRLGTVVGRDGTVGVSVVPVDDR